MRIQNLNTEFISPDITADAVRLTFFHADLKGLSYEIY